MRKIAVFHGILARKVPRIQFPRPIFLPLIKHNISYFLYQNIQILMIHFFGPRKRKIENDHFLEIYCTFPNSPGKLKILLKVTKHLNIMWQKFQRDRNWLSYVSNYPRVRIRKKFENSKKYPSRHNFFLRLRDSYRPESGGIQFV